MRVLTSFFADFNGELDQLIVILSIPAVYNDFSAIESLIKGRGMEIEDDLLDHWRAAEHNEERIKLFQKLFNFAIKNHTRITLISGDVHIGALGLLEDEKGLKKSNTASINSLITSAIVNVPPDGTLVSVLEYNALSIESITTKENDKYRASLVKFPPHKRDIYIGNRNLLELIGTTNHGIICNWISEDIAKQYCFYINPPTAGASSDLRFS